MTPLVSVVIPTFNGAAWIAETLEGVRRQSFRDFETIVVDDGSSDGTGEVVQEFQPSVRYSRESNRGAAAARNRGVSLSRGRYIAFCDHDDVWRPRHLESLVQGFEAHPSAALVFDNAEHAGHGRTMETLHLTGKRLVSLVGGKVRPEAIWHCCIASMSVVMVKKEVFEKLGGLNEQVIALDDLHFYLRVAATEEVRYVDYVGCRKRVTEQSLWHQAAVRGNVQCLEDLWRHHPEVVRSIGSVKFRLRLARRYSKLGKHYRDRHESRAAREIFWRAYKANFVDLRYLWRALSG